MRSSLKCAVAISLLLCMWAMPAQAKKLALVIGIDNYQNLDKSAQLERARNDAKVVGQTLASLGFFTIEGYNLTRQGMQHKLDDLLERIEPGDEVAFFYAGHGVSIDGQNYLMPADISNFSPAQEDRVKAGSFRVGRLIEKFKARGSRINILFLDACRNNPFRDKLGRSTGGPNGLSPEKDPGQGTMVIFSAGEGQVALDSLTNVQDNHINSVFTRSLIPLLVQKNLEIKSLANVVRDKVFRLAKQDDHTQVPASYNEILNNYYLAGRDNLKIAAGPKSDNTSGKRTQRRIFVDPDKPSGSTQTASRDIALVFHTTQERFVKGQPVNFVVRSSRPCYLTLINIPDKGKSTVIYPNRYNQINKIDGDITYNLPGDLIKNFKFRFSSAGIEHVVAICNATRPDPAGIVHDFRRHAFTTFSNPGLFLRRTASGKRVVRQLLVEEDKQEKGRGLPTLVKSRSSGDIEARRLVTLKVRNR